MIALLVYLYSANESLRLEIHRFILSFIRWHDRFDIVFNKNQFIHVRQIFGKSEKPEYFNIGSAQFYTYWMKFTDYALTRFSTFYCFQLISIFSIMISFWIENWNLSDLILPPPKINGILLKNELNFNSKNIHNNRWIFVNNGYDTSLAIKFIIYEARVEHFVVCARVYSYFLFSVNLL